MNLCYVANSRFPSERAHMTHIVQMCNAFAALGHTVTLLVTNRPSGITENPETFFGLKFNFNVVRIPVPDVAGNAYHLPVCMRPYAFLLQRLVFALRTAQYLRSTQCDHIYGRDEWIVWLLSYVVRIPCTWESHEAKFSTVVRRLIARTKKLIVISEGIREFYVSNGIPASDILVAHDAVDERFFLPHISRADARRTLNITTSKPVVMYIGGLDTWKGVGTLFEAAKNQDDFEVYVIGGKESELAPLQKEYPHVHFLGSRPYKELPQHQQAADVLVVPNTGTNALSAEYTSPLKLFAHMTAKKPIVASRIPSITHVLSSDEVAFFEADNPEALRATITQVLQEEEAVAATRAALMYEKSRGYTWQKRAEGILSFLRN